MRNASSLSLVFFLDLTLGFHKYFSFLVVLQKLGRWFPSRLDNVYYYDEDGPNQLFTAQPAGWFHFPGEPISGRGRIVPTNGKAGNPESRPSNWRK